jgi:hypothetical protein
MNVRFAAAILVLSSALAPVHAGEQPGPKGPPKTMGDEGKLPATDKMTGKTPDMRGPEVPGTTTTESTSPKGPTQRMGDEGKLPPTGTMRDETPDMRGSSDK